MILCLKFLGSETKVLTYNYFYNEEGMHCFKPMSCLKRCHVVCSDWNKMKTQIYSKSRSCEGMKWNHCCTSIWINVAFCCQFQQHYIKFVARTDSCYNIHSQVFVSRKPIPQFMKLERQELCITSEKLRGITFTGTDQWADS